MLDAIPKVGINTKANFGKESNSYGVTESVDNRDNKGNVSSGDMQNFQSAENVHIMQGISYEEFITFGVVTTIFIILLFSLLTIMLINSAVRNRKIMDRMLNLIDYKAGIGS